VSNVGKTLLKGHTLRAEGAVVFDSRGLSTWWNGRDNRYAKCSCEQLSPANISQNAAKKWYREHKDAIRAAAPQSEPQP